MNFDNTKIVKLDNTNNNDNFVDDSQKSEFANIMLLMTSRNEILNLGKVIHEKGFSFDGIGNWKFFENNIKFKRLSTNMYIWAICLFSKFIFI